jgi:hypothetical protein
MAWRKLGQLYAPQPVHAKLASHAANPLAVHREGNIYRIFYSGRDGLKRSSVGYVDADITTVQLLEVGQAPVFEHGPVGSFYEAGVSIGNVYTAGDQRYMLFMGWQNPPGGHWRGDIGRLKLHDDLSLMIDAPTPFLGSDATDPLSLSYPWVEARDSGGFDMWYGSTLAWDAGNGEMLHVINHATSSDGDSWQRNGQAVPSVENLAQAFSRPTVLRDQQGEHMWFSYRGLPGQPYRIGYAFKEVGGEWQLQLDRAGIDVSATGWDSEMICYPFVFDHGGNRYMLYNGNGYGKTGFGLAVWDA